MNYPDFFKHAIEKVPGLGEALNSTPKLFEYLNREYVKATEGEIGSDIGYTQLFFPDIPSEGWENAKK